MQSYIQVFVVCVLAGLAIVCADYISESVLADAITKNIQEYQKRVEEKTIHDQNNN